MMSIYHYIINHFNDSPLIIKFSVYLSIAFVVTIIALILYVKYLRNNLRIKDRVKVTYVKKFESELITYLYSSDENGKISFEQKKIVAYLKKCTRNTLKRKIIISFLNLNKVEIIIFLFNVFLAHFFK